MTYKHNNTDKNFHWERSISVGKTDQKIRGLRSEICHRAVEKSVLKNWFSRMKFINSLTFPRQNLSFNKTRYSTLKVEIVEFNWMWNSSFHQITIEYTKFIPKSQTSFSSYFDAEWVLDIAYS